MAQAFKSVVKLDSGLLIPAGAGAGKVLTSDASGNASWATVSASGATYVTSLPASPVDGQEVYYAADATNGVIWHLRYRSGSASTYKWEFVGGAPLSAFIGTAQTTASTSYTALATVGPSITVPLGGDYLVQWGSVGSNAGGIALHGFDVGASVASDNNSVRSGTQQASGTSHVVKPGLAASTALVSKYRVTAGTGNWEQRWMNVHAIRVG